MVPLSSSHPHLVTLLLSSFEKIHCRSNTCYREQPGDEHLQFYGIAEGEAYLEYSFPDFSVFHHIVINQFKLNGVGRSITLKFNHLGLIARRLQRSKRLLS